MWLVRDGEVLATAEVADDRAHARRGLLGRDAIDGVLVLRPCRHVHTFRMRFAIDVAFCDVNGLVLRTCSLRAGAACRPSCRGAAFAIEAEAGRVRTLAAPVRRPGRARG